MPQPNKIPLAFAASGDKNTIPESSGALGFASWQEGFPAITGTPFAQGGVAPKRADFNGIFNALSLAILWQQQGGFYAYDATTDYEVGNVVEYNGDLYKCLSANGPSSAVKAPTDATIWDKVMTAADAAALYLPLSGGMMTGNILFNKTIPSISSLLDDTYIRILNVDYDGGAGLYLSGKNRTTNTGYFTLYAYDGVNRRILIGAPDGSLTWDGKDIAVVDSVDSTNSGYVRFTNGVQILWGNVNVASESGTAVTFEKAFSSTPRIFTNVAFSSQYGHGMTGQAINRTTTGFTAYIGSSKGGATQMYATGNMNYLAIGPWA